MQMDTAQYQKYHEEKCHTPADFPYNTYLCTIPLDFQAVSTHWHDEIELIAVKKGEGWVDVNLKRHAVTAGDIVLVLSGQLHAIAQKGCAVMEYETILFRPELLAAENDACYARFLQPFFAETQEIAPVLTPECRNYPAISVLLERIDTLCDARPYGYPLAVKGCLFQMFYEIISAERTETEHSLDRKSLAKIKEILSYIADNYSRPISIAEIASACFYSESYFMKFFQARHGHQLRPVPQQLPPGESRQASAGHLGYHFASRHGNRFRQPLLFQPLLQKNVRHHTRKIPERSSRTCF